MDLKSTYTKVTDYFKPGDGPELSFFLRISTAILLLFLLIFVLWSLFAQLESAAVAQGKVIVASKRQIVRHKEGGIIEKIYVRNGDRVKKGAVLIDLEKIQPSSQFIVLKDRKNTLLAMEARLKAERDNNTKVEYPVSLLKLSDLKEVRELINSQSTLFATNLKNYQDQVKLLQQKISQHEKEILSIESLVKAGERQLDLVREEEEAVKELEKKKLVRKPRLLSLQRELARLEGERDKNIALIANSKLKIGEVQLQLIALENDRTKKALDQLLTIQTELADVSPRLAAAKDILERTSITSPKDGIVFNLQFHTPETYIQPGSTVMEIVPVKDEMIIEAFVNPLDIDVVKPGLEANIMLTPYKQRNMLQIQGKVVHVSADAVVNPQNNSTYYLARVEIPASELEKLNDVNLYPGMPAQVMIVTGKQTPFEYFSRPIKDSFQRAFRED